MFELIRSLGAHALIFSSLSFVFIVMTQSHTHMLGCSACHGSYLLSSSTPLQCPGIEPSAELYHQSGCGLTLSHTACSGSHVFSAVLLVRLLGAAVVMVLVSVGGSAR